MSQGGASYGGSHGMGGGGAAAKAATPAPQAAPQTREQQLLARIKGDPSALMRMSDQDALDTVKAIEQQSITQDGTQNDTFVQRYLTAIGWAESKPEVLSDTAYETARRKAGEDSMYHADNGPNAAVGTGFSKQLLQGSTMYASDGIFGGGTYWAYNDASGSAFYGDYQVKSFLNQNARIIDKGTLDTQISRLSRTKPKLYNALRNAKKSYGRDQALYTVLASAQGCNVILAHNARRAGAYVVTLDRSALTMSSKTIRDARYGIANW